MLNNIRQMITQKKEYLEAASIIFEDGVGNLDDAIILGEETDLPDPDMDEATTEPIENDSESDEDETSDDGENDDSQDEPPQEEETPVQSQEEEPNPPEEAPVENEGEGSPMPLPTADGELPTPVGAQTGEPITDPDDLLDVSVDLKSNTIRDVLPVPPANAAEALGGDDDDILNQRIDSGFGSDDVQPSGEPEVDMTPAQPGPNPQSQEEEPNPPEEAPVENEETEEDGELTEAITLGNDAPATEEPPAEDGGTEDTPPDENTEEAPDTENSVTAAVKDKVDEITSEPSGGEPASKDDLLKKLGNITKSLEDAKKAVMNTLQ